MPKAAGLLDFGGELLDARHDPLLLVERGEGDFASKQVSRSYGSVTGRALGLLIQLVLQIVRGENGPQICRVNSVLA